MRLSLFDIWYGQYSYYGIKFLSIDNIDDNKSLLSICYDTSDNYLEIYLFYYCKFYINLNKK